MILAKEHGAKSVQNEPALSGRKRHLALLALAVMVLTWGYNWVIMKRVLDYAGPFDFQAIRNVLGALFLFALLAVRKSNKSIGSWPRVFLYGMLQTAGFSCFMQLALLNGGAGKTSILVFTMPFWVVPMAWIAFGERVRGLQWLALALAGLGVLLILEPWNSTSSLASKLLAIAGGLCWASATIVLKWIRRDYQVGGLALTAWQMAFGAAALVIVALLVPEKPIQASAYFFGALAYNVLIISALNWLLWVFALQYLSVGVASMAALCTPVIGVLAGWLELGERPGALELAGMLAIAAALLVLGLRALKNPGD